MARVLIGCESSGRVREAFRARGHDAWSCDLLPADDGSPYHVQADVLTLLGERWDAAIFHPPCTHLSVSGARWATDHWVKSKKHPSGRYWHDGAEKRYAREQALLFVRQLISASFDIPHVCIENPISVISTRIRKPDQTIQPWMFGHGETKATCLWLKGLPKLVPTNIVAGRGARIHKLPPSPDRWKLRSVTYEGIAKAMADQWLT